jgi:hypothetical protein
MQNVTDWAQQNIAGSYATQEDAAERLKLAAEHCHLVGGASVCPLRIGHEIVISVVPIRMANAYPVNKTAKAVAKGKQPDPQHEDYEVPKYGVGKADLKALAAAAGVEWTDCKRLDNGRDPYFCHFEVHGRYRQIDGSYRNFNDQRDVDLREGSPQIAGMGDYRIQSLRENMVRLGITKARLRAIRAAFGVPHSMTVEEMAKPWVFSRMIFTGEDRDPQVRRVFAAVIAQQQLAAAGALYGPAAGSPALPSLLQPVALSGHQHAGALPAADDDFDEDGVLMDEPPPRPAPAPAPPAPPPAAAPQAPRAQQPAAKTAQSGRRTGFKIPGGKEKGKDLADASDGTLTWWLNRIETDLNEGTMESQYRDYNTKLLAAMKEELTRRTGSKQQTLDSAAQPQGRELGSDG